MSEMDFTPSSIEVKRGGQVRLVVRNIGSEDHAFLLAIRDKHLEHAEIMKKNPRTEHDDPIGVRLAPKKSAGIPWKVTKTGCSNIYA